jgi:hypothetical protein
MPRKLQNQDLRTLPPQLFLARVNSPVLEFENADEFKCLLRALKQEIKPQGFVEDMYLSDFAALVWEILRLRRCKKEVLNREFRDQLHEIFKEHCVEEDKGQAGRFPYDEIDVEKFEQLCALGDRWFTDVKARQKAAELMDGYEINDGEIEASVFRNPPWCVEKLDEVIAS